MMSSQPYRKEVSIIIPYRAGNILMQLRDEKQGIAFPGHWGFFGGSIEGNEAPIEAARRELFEEIGLVSENLISLGVEEIRDFEEVSSHAFCFRLEGAEPVFNQQEGLDFAFVSYEQMLSGHIYSERQKQSFPVVPLDYIRRVAKKAYETLESQTSIY